MKRKKLTASMIALVMSVSLPMTTYAANWYQKLTYKSPSSVRIGRCSNPSPHPSLA